MSPNGYSGYQKKVIDSYYRNIDTIALTRLQELASELYLADSEKKRDRLWGYVKQNLTRLKIQPDVANHILSARDVQILAKNIQDWLART